MSTQAYAEADNGGADEDVDMDAATPTTAVPFSAFLTGVIPSEAEATKRDTSEISKISLSNSELESFVLAGSSPLRSKSSSSALSALAHLAATAPPIVPESSASGKAQWKVYPSGSQEEVSGNLIVIDSKKEGEEEQRAIKVPLLSAEQNIGVPYLFSCRNPILDNILGNSDSDPIKKEVTHSGNIGISGRLKLSRDLEQGSGEQGNFDFDTDNKKERTKEVGSIPPLNFSSNLIHLPPLSLSLSQPSPSRNPAPIPEALSLSARSIRPSPLSLGQAASPRHSPYSHPSARLLGNSADTLRSARIRLNNSATMSPSSTSTSSASQPPLGPGALPPTTPPSHSSGFHTPLASPSSSMSMSKRRRAPEWPSPRTHHPRSQSTSRYAPPPASAFSRDLAQTVRTPAILRVPPTPDYSPAFYRSGFATHPESASAGPVPIPPYTQEGPNPNSNSEPLGRRASAFGSAPTLDTPRLPDPPMTPGPITGNSVSAAAKRQRVNLMGIPKGWVIEQLNRRAGQYWHNPSTSDIRILVPVPRSRLPKRAQTSTTPLTQESAQSFHSNQPGHTVWPVTPVLAGLVGATEGDKGLLNNVKAGHTSEASAGGRRGSLPGTDDVVALVFPLHQDYLITQSSLFRSLFAPAPPSHLDAPVAPRTIKGARRLPTSPSAPPAVLLPLPDPASFSVLVHWLYWGDITALESALSRGLVEWQGVVKNVHYLGMDDNVKRVLGKWWRKWVKTDEGRARSGAALGSKKKGREGWADSDDEDEEVDAADESESGQDRGDMMEMDGHPSLRHTQSTRDVDDGGVSGLLRAL